MGKLGGYKAKTYVLVAPPTTTAAPADKVLDLVDDIVKAAQKTAQTVKNVDSALSKKVDEFDKAAEKQPLLLFKALPQRACAWSKYKQGTDWLFASKKSDSKDKCARACVA